MKENVFFILAHALQMTWHPAVVAGKLQKKPKHHESTNLEGHAMKSVFALGAVAAAVLLGAASSAHATPTLSFIIDGVPVATCEDGDACDGNALAGVVAFNGSLGSFLVNVTTGITKPVLTGSPALIDLNSVNVRVTGGSHTLQMLFSDTGFTGPAGVMGSFGGTIGGTPGWNVKAEGFYGAGLFDTSNSIGVIGPFGGPAFSGVTGVAAITQPVYSLTQRITLVTTGPGSFSGDFDLRIPEPGTLALAGLALLGLGALRRRSK